MHYSEGGQPLTGSLLDYPLPHARDMLEIHVDTIPTLSPTNALGLKGIGELPTVACPVALVNAAVDALSGANLQQLDAPLTTEKLWRALHGRVSAATWESCLAVDTTFVAIWYWRNTA